MIIELKEKKISKEVIDYVNRIRKELDGDPIEELPLGVPGEPDSSCGKIGCTIANALSDLIGKYGRINVDDENITVWDEDEVIFTTKPPKYISEFIIDFDNGKYPQLIEGLEKRILIYIEDIGI